MNYILYGLKTLKLLWFLGLCKWTPPGFWIWILPRGSQLPVHPSYKKKVFLKEQSEHSKDHVSLVSQKNAMKRQHHIMHHKFILLLNILE